MKRRWELLKWVGVLTFFVVFAVFTLRPEPLALSAVFLVCAFFPSFRASKWKADAFAVLILLSAINPIGITFRNAPGGPHLVQCCPPLLPSLRTQALKEYAQGTCVPCSDVISGFEPKWYVVW